ncbi:hypothetical protein JXA47_00205 [Candidatus Sumerlaeota bacterium]|nr:hypothetical protein [Candidatus Sumerlaeota bacterium]
MSEESKVTAADVKAAGNAALGDSIAVLVNPDGAIPKVAGAQGYLIAAVIGAAFVILGTIADFLTLRMMMGSFAGFDFFIKHLIGLLVCVAILVGVVYGIAISLAGKQGLRPEQAGNAVAVCLVPWFALMLLTFIVSAIKVDWASYLIAAGPGVAMIFLSAALNRGLEFSVRASIYTTILAFAVGLVVMGFIG